LHAFLKGAVEKTTIRPIEAARFENRRTGTGAIQAAPSKELQPKVHAVSTKDADPV
jgi:hypothetical protein